MVERETYFGRADNFDKNMTLDCLYKHIDVVFRVPQSAIDLYLASLHPEIVDGEDKLPDELA